VVADPELLKTCFLNLMINAVDAMPGGGDLRVDVRRARETGADALAITVTDTGAGMSPEDVRAAFEPYFSTKDAGLGLGLALTRKILADHGGSITLESAPGRGTTARIVLPLIAEGIVPARPREAVSRPSRWSSQPPPSARGRRVTGPSSSSFPSRRRPASLSSAALTRTSCAPSIRAPANCCGRRRCPPRSTVPP